MRKAYLILIWIWIVNSSEGQEVTFLKKEGTDLSNLEFKSSFDDKKKVFFNISKKLTSETKNFKLGPEISIRLNKNEELLYATTNSVYEIHYTAQARKLVKYQANAIIGQNEFPLEGALEIINEDGYLIHTDELDGNITTYFFYSPDLKQLNFYKPYGNAGSIWNKYGYSDSLFCIYSLENLKSERYKLAVLDHKGNLLLTREFNHKGFLPSDIKIINDKIFLLLNGTIVESAKSKVLAFDINLNNLWQKESPLRVAGYNIITSKKNNSLLLITQEHINNVDALSGKDKWVTPLTSLLENPYPFKTIQSDYVINDHYIAINIGDLRSQDSKIRNNILSIIDINSGVKLYSEKLGDVDIDDEIKIVGGVDTFLVFLNSRILEYRKQ